MFHIKYSKSNKPNELNWSFSGTPIPEHEELYDKFFDAYDIQVLYEDQKMYKRKLIPKPERKCRFCDATFSEDEKFKTTAHLFSRLIGTQYLFSDFECDKCNNIFSRWETDLSSYLCISRSFGSPLKSASRVNFIPTDKSFEIRKTPVDKNQPGNKINLIFQDDSKAPFTVNENDKKITINTIKTPYIPKNVYKAFLKMALSILPEKYLPAYKSLFAFVRSPATGKPANHDLFELDYYLHPGPPFPNPIFILFQKRNQNAAMPTHVFCVLFNNHTYQLILPGHQNDKWFYNGKTKVYIPVIPPFIDAEFAKKYGNPVLHTADFRSDELMKNEPYELTLTFQSVINGHA